MIHLHCQFPLWYLGRHSGSCANILYFLKLSPTSITGICYNSTCCCLPNSDFLFPSCHVVIRFFYRKNCPFLNLLCTQLCQYGLVAIFYELKSSTTIIILLLRLFNFGNQEELLQSLLCLFKRALKPFRASPLFPAPQNVRLLLYFFPAHTLDSRASSPQKVWFLFY